MCHMDWLASQSQAAIVQLEERQTEDLKVPGSIPGLGKFFLREFSVHNNDGNNKLPASAFSPKHDSVSERLRRWTRNSGYDVSLTR